MLEHMNVFSCRSNSPCPPNTRVFADVTHCSTYLYPSRNAYILQQPFCSSEFLHIFLLNNLFNNNKDALCGSKRMRCGRLPWKGAGASGWGGDTGLSRPFCPDILNSQRLQSCLNPLPVATSAQRQRTMAARLAQQLGARLGTLITRGRSIADAGLPARHSTSAATAGAATAAANGNGGPAAVSPLVYP